MKSALVFASLLCVFAACTDEATIVSEGELSPVQMYMADPDAVARGEALFKGSCAEFCHTLEPVETDASFLFACDWLQQTDDAAIAETIKSGIPDTRMVGFGANFPDGDSDIWRLIAFLRTNQTSCS